MCQLRLKSSLVFLNPTVFASEITESDHEFNQQNMKCLTGTGILQVCKSYACKTVLTVTVHYVLLLLVYSCSCLSAEKGWTRKC
jgi:hypothetical protein